MLRLRCTQPPPAYIRCFDELSTHGDVALCPLALLPGPVSSPPTPGPPAPSTPAPSTTSCCGAESQTRRGEEVSIILVGTLRDHGGRLLGPGDELIQATGTQHDITAVGDEVIFVARAMGGIEVGRRA